MRSKSRDKPGGAIGLALVAIAMVTGAARGIGRATAVAFAGEGADVMGLDIAGPTAAVAERWFRGPSRVIMIGWVGQRWS